MRVVLLRLDQFDPSLVRIPLCLRCRHQSLSLLFVLECLLRAGQGFIHLPADLFPSLLDLSHQALSLFQQADCRFRVAVLKSALGLVVTAAGALPQVGPVCLQCAFMRLDHVDGFPCRVISDHIVASAERCSVLPNSRLKVLRSLAARPALAGAQNLISQFIQSSIDLLYLPMEVGVSDLLAEEHLVGLKAGFLHCCDVLADDPQRRTQVIDTSPLLLQTLTRSQTQQCVQCPAVSGVHSLHGLPGCSLPGQVPRLLTLGPFGFTHQLYQPILAHCFDLCQRFLCFLKQTCVFCLVNDRPQVSLSLRVVVIQCLLAGCLQQIARLSVSLALIRRLQSWLRDRLDLGRLRRCENLHGFLPQEGRKIHRHLPRHSLLLPVLESPGRVGQFYPPRVLSRVNSLLAGLFQPLDVVPNLLSVIHILIPISTALSLLFVRWSQFSPAAQAKPGASTGCLTTYRTGPRLVGKCLPSHRYDHTQWRTTVSTELGARAIYVIALRTGSGVR